jgi:CRISPR-associated protein Csm1
MCLEVLVDELLESAKLSRANLLYTGGGGAYLLLPNTKKANDELVSFEEETNNWLRKTYGTNLYLAVASKEFCSNTLYFDKNKASDQEKVEISEIYRAVTDVISDKKLSRYNAKQIQELNILGKHKGRECKVCHRVDENIKKDEGSCELCQDMLKLGKAIQSQKKALDKDGAGIGGVFYTVPAEIKANGKQESDELKLPISSTRVLKYANSTAEITNIMNNTSKVKVYSINTPASGKDYATNLWIGNYFTKWEYTKYAKIGIGSKNLGIKRMAAMRLDVDDLGTAFISGFAGKYNTLTRSAALSRNMSLFFKYHINKVLENKTGNFLRLRDENEQENNGRDITIIYAGGDDVFLIGFWVDVIEFAIDFNTEIQKFTNGKLTVSAGLGLYGKKTSIPYIAENSGDLETAAKSYTDASGNLVKNAISLFEEDSVYSWDDFKDKLIGEKYKCFKEFLESQSEEKQERGMSFLYKLLILLREANNEGAGGISTARLAYTLAKLEPPENKEKTQKEKFEIFKKDVYKWAQNKTDRNQLIDALQLYVLTKRKDGGDND